MNQAQDAEDLMMAARRDRFGLEPRPDGAMRILKSTGEVRAVIDSSGNWRRTAPAVLLAIASVATSGCASSLLIEAEHISHPTAGWPVSPNTDEAGLSQANLLLRWRRGLVYLDAGLGVNLQGRNGGGFYGPPLTATARIGVELPLGGRRAPLEATAPPAHDSRTAGEAKP